MTITVWQMARWIVASTALMMATVLVFLALLYLAILLVARTADRVHWRKKRREYQKRAARRST